MFFNKIIFLILIFTTLGLQAQMTEVRGKVIDGKTKELLSYANVKFKGSANATITDTAANFVLRTLDKVDSLVVSYLGYPSKTIKIYRGRTQDLVIEMGSESIQIKEVNVKAGKRKRYVDTTANYVYYKVLQHKEVNKADHIDNYKLQEYAKLEVGLLNVRPKLLNFFLFKPFKFCFENRDTLEDGQVFIRGLMKEDIWDVYYKKNPKSYKRITTAVYMTGIQSKSISDLANYTFEKIDAYGNIFVIANKSFISPFSPAAIVSYRYFLTDTQKLDGRVSYKLHFVAKNKADMALKGFAWIDSATWALKSIYFKPNEKANINYIKDYSIDQKFTLVDSAQWLLTSEDLNTVGTLFKLKKLQTAILVQKHFERRNIDLHPVFPDTIFNNAAMEPEIIKDNARNYDRTWWSQNRFSPLNKFEEKLLDIHDTLPKTRAYKGYMWGGRLLTSGYFQTGKVEWGRFYKFLSRNSVEGYRVRFGGQTDFRMSRIWNINAYGAYGLKDKDFKYSATFRTLLPSHHEKWKLLELSYTYDMSILGQEDMTLSFDNMLTLIRAKQFSKIMKIRQWNISYENEWLRGLSSIFTLNNKRFYQIPSIFDFALPQTNGTYKALPYFDQLEFSIDTRIAYRDKYFRSGWYRYFTVTRFPVFNFRYGFSSLNIDGKLMTNHKFNLSYMQRISWQAGYTRVEVRAGAIVGPSPYPISFVTAPNFGIVFDKTNYNMTKEFEFVMDKYASIWVEHHFDGYFLNKIPLINRLQLREIIWVKSLWGSYSNKNAAIFKPVSGVSSPFPIPYIEAGIGVGNIFKLMRIDFCWRATHRDQTIVPNFAVKLSLAPTF